MFKKYFICLLATATFAVQSQEVTRVAVTEAVTECTNKTNGTGALIGAGAGYVVGRALFGKGMGGLLGAATGGVAGSQINKQKDCHLVQKTVGYKTYQVIDGKLVEGFEPVQ